MKRLLDIVLKAGASRVVAPLVISLFFLLYIAVAFFTDEALITLVTLTGRIRILAVLFALIPASIMVRILVECGRFAWRRRAAAGRGGDTAGLYDEVVELPGANVLHELEERLTKAGYRTRSAADVLVARRGVSLFPARLFFLIGMFCLFTGILVSVTSRTSQRRMVVEGEPLPVPGGSGGMVERIILAQSTGLILNRTLTIESAAPGGEVRRFVLYPPALSNGYFVYPRYIGLAVNVRLSAPDLPFAYEAFSAVNTFPPGKEGELAIQGSPYRVVFTLPEPEPGSDRYLAYMTGDFPLQFKLMKDRDLLFSGDIRKGGTVDRDGYHLTVPSVRRMVITDFIRDYGVLFIWAAALCISVAGLLWLPIRLLVPLGELLFRYESGTTRACFRAEGGVRRHAGVFHEALDVIDARGKAPVS